MKHVFGPVASRRLGRSLGIDVVPYKTCTHDCVYCQLSRSTRLTIDPQEWVSLDEVLAEVQAALGAHPDFLTLSGSGEPTLYSKLGALIDQLKRLTSVPVAVLTNGSLLWRGDVREALLQADVVIPSLDAGDEETYRAINRPHNGLSFEQVFSGLIDFRRAYRGRYWLEVFLIDGPLSEEPHLSRLIARVNQIGADRVQLNTVTRPPAEAWAAPVRFGRLAEMAGRFRPTAEVIAARQNPVLTRPGGPSPDAVLALLERRPCDLTEIARGLALHRNEVMKVLDALLANRRVEPVVVDGCTCYVPRRSSSRKG